MNLLKNWLIHIIVNTVVLMTVAGYIKTIYINGFWAALEAGFILSILNVVIRPILIILTLPVTVLTMGLFLFIINALTLSLTAWLMGNNFQIEGFGSALLASIVISILSLLIQTFIVRPLNRSKR
ncbi:phage holin family protein [Camelliibacillus cellulosilyticus]|uniref:Phage holin family protein n=1 Tax=Camelliibacillus cellulosilyticus TaxID=2174486 RepID=A0ABV9GPL6_9BACL